MVETEVTASSPRTPQDPPEEVQELKKKNGAQKSSFALFKINVAGLTEHVQCERYHSILFLIGGKRLVANVSRCCFSQLFKSHNDVRLHHKAFLFNDRFFYQT